MVARVLEVLPQPCLAPGFGAGMSFAHQLLLQREPEASTAPSPAAPGLLPACTFPLPLLQQDPKGCFSRGNFCLVAAVAGSETELSPLPGILEGSGSPGTEAGSAGSRRAVPSSPPLSGFWSKSSAGAVLPWLPGRAGPGAGDAQSGRGLWSYFFTAACAWCGAERGLRRAQAKGQGCPLRGAARILIEGVEMGPLEPEEAGEKGKLSSKQPVLICVSELQPCLLHFDGETTESLEPNRPILSSCRSQTLKSFSCLSCA